LLNQDRNSDHTQMIYLVNKYLIEKECVSPKIFSNDYQAIYILYDKVLNKYSRDFIELPQYYNTNDEYQNSTNYVLKQIIEIMIHVFKHIISLNFITILSRAIIKLTNKSLEDVYKILNSEITLSFEEKKIKFMDYCFTNLPVNAIKIILKVKETIDDVKKLSVETIFRELINGLSKIEESPLDNSDVNKLLKDILPYISLYTEKYVSEMYSFMSKQLRSFMMQNKYLLMLSEISGRIE